MSTLQIVLAHADLAIRTRCEELLTAAGHQVAAADQEAYSALGLVNRLQPDLLLLDLALARTSWAALLPLIQAKSPATRLLVVVDGDSDAAIMAALADGAIGYLDRDQLEQFVVKAAEAVCQGEAWVSRQMVAKILAAVWSSALDIQDAVV